MSEGLRERLADASAALPFAEAVLAQLTGPTGAFRDASASERDRLSALLADLLLTAGGAGEETLAGRLVEEHALVAALFQNAELLPQRGNGGSDAVGRVVMRVLDAWHSTEAESR